MHGSRRRRRHRRIHSTTKESSGYAGQVSTRKLFNETFDNRLEPNSVVGGCKVSAYGKDLWTATLLTPSPMCCRDSFRIRLSIV